MCTVNYTGITLKVIRKALTRFTEFISMSIYTQYAHTYNNNNNNNKKK